MTDLALQIETKPIECYSAYDATIEIEWVIPFSDPKEKVKIGFVGFYFNYNESEKNFRSRVLKAYDAIRVAYENWPDGDIHASIMFADTNANM